MALDVAAPRDKRHDLLDGLPERRGGQVRPSCGDKVRGLGIGRIYRPEGGVRTRFAIHSVNYFRPDLSIARDFQPLPCNNAGKATASSRRLDQRPPERLNAGNQQNQPVDARHSGAD